MSAPVALRIFGYGIEMGRVKKAYMKKELEDSLLQAWIAAGKVETEVIDMDQVDV